MSFQNFGFSTFFTENRQNLYDSKYSLHFPALNFKTKIEYLAGVSAIKEGKGDFYTHWAQIWESTGAYG